MENTKDDRDDPALMALTVLITNFHLGGVDMRPYLRQIEDLAGSAEKSGRADAAQQLRRHVSRVERRIAEPAPEKH